MNQVKCVKILKYTFIPKEFFSSLKLFARKIQKFISSIALLLNTIYKNHSTFIQKSVRAIFNNTTPNKRERHLRLDMVKGKRDRE